MTKEKKNKIRIKWSFILYIGTVASEDEIENEKKLTSSYEKFSLGLRVGPHF